MYNNIRIIEKLSKPIFDLFMGNYVTVYIVYLLIKLRLILNYYSILVTVNKLKSEYYYIRASHFISQ